MDMVIDEKRMLRKRAILIALLLGVCQCCGAQSGSGDCDGLLRSMRKSRIPDVAVAVFANGEVHFSYCSTGERALRPDAIFEAASLSKPVFAAAVLTLVDEKRLDLDTPLSTYLREPYRHSRNAFNAGAVKDPVADARLRRVTARMVLSHTAGLPNWDHSSSMTLRDEPGSRWAYSGEGYIYLQRVVEAITGEPLNLFVGRTIFEPLGMTQSSFIWRDEYAKRAVSGHDVSGKATAIDRYNHPLASSTLYTTLEDYSLFVAALLRKQKSTVYDREEQPQVVVRGDLGLRWGLGVAIESSSGSIFHWGANPGFQSLFFITPQEQKGVLFLTDSDAGLDLVNLMVNRYDRGAHPALRFPMLHPKD